MGALGLVEGKVWVRVGVMEVGVRMGPEAGVEVCRGRIRWVI